jgi:type VI secretion system protein ImpJ
MSPQAVHWYQGMFLRPHHFQQADRYTMSQLDRQMRWQMHHCWGLKSIDIDREALANHRFVVRSLEARLRDGSLVCVPEDGCLAPLDLKPLLEREERVLIRLALTAGKPGCSGSEEGNGSESRCGYWVDTLSVEDENTGNNPQTVEIRRRNLRLLPATHSCAGYEVLELARVEKGARAELGPCLDGTYIPPLLSCDGWGPLATDIMQAVYDRVGKKLDLLVNQATTRGLTFDSLAQGDRMLLEQIRVLNEAVAELGVLAFTPGIHPLTAFTTLCRLAGQLAIFDPARRVPQLPRYDHDDLGGCFWRLRQYLDAFLDVFVEPPFKERPFLGAGLRMEVALEPAWVNPIWSMYLGVATPLSADDCVGLLTRPGQLDMKVGSAERVDALYRNGMAGLRFVHAPQVPQALPVRPGLHYFRIDRDSQPAEWAHVERSLTLAVRLNETRVLSGIHGQKTLAIRTSSGQTAALQFVLYVVAQTP